MTRSPELEAAIARAGERARAHGWDGPGNEHVVVELLAIPALRELLVSVDLDPRAFANHLEDRFATLEAVPPNDPAGVAQFLVRLELERGSALEPVLAPRVALGRLLTRQRRYEPLLRAYDLEPIDILYALAHGVARRDDDRSPPPPRAWLPRPRWPWRAARIGTYRVFVHNDDFTTLAIVHEALVDWFDVEPEDATALAQIVHSQGRGVVGLFALDDAARRIDEATRFAHDQGYPLRFSFEPADPETPSAAVP